VSHTHVLSFAYIIVPLTRIRSSGIMFMCMFMLMFMLTDMLHVVIYVYLNMLCCC
jgi:hypothetical protein